MKNKIIAAVILTFTVFFVIFCFSVNAEGYSGSCGSRYYFCAIGSANGSGYMCVQSRTIGGVWYKFTETGVCTKK
ncbi:MAG: hypothetical protein E7675_05270 [Ruminococcaceae bacterium]|nr:hypothetical protein [Oscillospiraceae bacterium]